MSYLILVRHGQSEWNLENKFTGWVDVDLTDKGKLEACKSGELIKEEKLKIKYFYSSIQKRSINTLKLILDTLRIKDKPIKAWQLNERHYGALTGLNKDEMKNKYGEKKIQEFRRSWNIKPDVLNKNNPYHAINIAAYNDVPRENIPDTESLEDTYNRVIPFYKENIEKKLNYNENILVVAHGNSIRALCKFLFQLDKAKISLLEIPTGNPLMISFDSKNKITKCNYLNKDRAKNLIAF